MFWEGSLKGFKKHVLPLGALALIVLTFVFGACAGSQDSASDGGHGSSDNISDIATTANLGPVPQPETPLDEGLPPVEARWSLTVTEACEEILQVNVSGCDPEDIQAHLDGILSEEELNDQCFFTQDGSIEDLYVSDLNHPYAVLNCDDYGCEVTIPGFNPDEACIVEFPGDVILL